MMRVAGWMRQDGVDDCLEQLVKTFNESTLHGGAQLQYKRTNMPVSGAVLCTCVHSESLVDRSTLYDILASHVHWADGTQVDKGDAATFVGFLQSTFVRSRGCGVPNSLHHILLMQSASQRRVLLVRGVVLLLHAASCFTLIPVSITHACCAVLCCAVLCCAVLCCAVLYTHVTTVIGMTGDRTRKLPQGERARYQGRLQSVSSGDTHGL